MNPTTIDHITVEVLSVADLEAALESFKLACRPSGKGRPNKTGRRTFVLKGLSIEARVGEKEVPPTGWVMSFGVFLNGRRSNMRQIARAAGPVPRLGLHT